MKLINYNDVYDNMAALVSFARKSEETTLCDRRSYFKSLNMVQQYKLRFLEHNDEPFLDFSVTHPQTNALLQSLIKSAEFGESGDLCPVDAEAVPVVTRNIRSAMDILETYNFEMYQIVNSLIAWVILIRKDDYACGSMWYALGSIFMSPNPGWTIVDYAENLLHETVHQAMFLDDMVHSLFEAPPSDLADESALVTSSIRETKRPYDCAFHAATVSVALIDFHERVGRAERATELCRPLMVTLSELEEKKHLLTARGQHILSDMIRLVKASSTFAALKEDNVALRH